MRFFLALPILAVCAAAAPSSEKLRACLRMCVSEPVKSCGVGSENVKMGIDATPVPLPKPIASPTPVPLPSPISVAKVCDRQCMPDAIKMCGEGWKTEESGVCWMCCKS
ncbi:hypothetical protein EK21DRAFT_89342 [Setomelanomma holmii]|uniref:Uncharacterized protein n=1 Tax=Setomelanomma holmii TaxID=210430 RepID=A0A9P4HA04_9PLEO|nr:hypothetical protein EK21DRAFT_89342 [Setomelanomma holmii]